MQRHGAGTAVAGVAALVLAVVLAVAVAIHPAPGALERSIDAALFAHRGSVAFGGFHAVTLIGSGAVVALAGVALAVWCWIRKERVLAVVCILGPAVAGVAEMVTKPMIGRVRPVTGGLTGESGFGFPSGHAAGATALACVGVLAAFRLLATRRARIAVVAGAVAYVVVVCASRLVVGAHYAADVLGGVLVGVAAALLVMSGAELIAARSVGVQRAASDMGA